MHKNLKLLLFKIQFLENQWENEKIEILELFSRKRKENCNAEMVDFSTVWRKVAGKCIAHILNPRRLGQGKSKKRLRYEKKLVQ